MKRKIIEIDEEKCTGCGLCAEACHEGAIAMVNGKARLIRDDYCDGFGDCLPACPVDAISFVEREAAPYDEAAVLAAKQERGMGQAYEAKQARETKQEGAAFVGCPGSAPRDMRTAEQLSENKQVLGVGQACDDKPAPVSELHNWPIQIKLAPTSAPYFVGADLLIAADCTAFSFAAFQASYLHGKTLLIGCPKLDAIDYSEKLSTILANNDIKSLTVARMEVPCCGGLEHATRAALDAANSKLPLAVVTIGIDGNIKS